MLTPQMTRRLIRIGILVCGVVIILWLLGLLAHNRPATRVASGEREVLGSAPHNFEDVARPWT